MSPIPSSSPVRKKSVAFSDDIAYNDDSPAVVSSPDPRQTPRGSILKTYNMSFRNGSPADPSNTSLWTRSPFKNDDSYEPRNPVFWLSGTIVQLPPNSSELPRLVDGCVRVLQDPQFDKKFEVYATINHICKSNTNDTLLRIFSAPVSQMNSSPTKAAVTRFRTFQPDSNYIIALAAQIRRDIVVTETEIFNRNDIIKHELSTSQPLMRSDPFRIRIINQALKLINTFLMNEDLNGFVPVEDVRWFYRHCCSILTTENISKALVSPYLIVIKDCRLINKKKRMLFDNPELPELMISSIINMRSYPSSTIVSERFLCFKNFANNFPNIMAKNINHWFEVFVLNVCSMASPFSPKTLEIGTNCLLEIAKVFLDNVSVQSSVTSLLSSKISNDVKSLASENGLDLDIDLISSEVSVIDYICMKLEEMIETGRFKESMEIWVSITLLVGDGGSSFDQWEHLNKWLRVQKICFNSQYQSAKIIALNSWKAVIYNVCHNDMDFMMKVVEPILKNPDVKQRQQMLNACVKSRIRLLTHVFFSISSPITSKEIAENLNHLFMAILYSLLKPLLAKLATKYLHIYWDKVIQPMILNFFFKKENSSLHLHSLGLKVLLRLLKPTVPPKDRNNQVRCLANDPISILEIPCLPCRWVYSKFDRIIPHIALVFQLDHLAVDQKVNLFISFLTAVKMVTKKEPRTTDQTFDIIESLPFVLEQLFKTSSLSFDSAYNLVINLNDTFKPATLVTRSISERTSESNLNIYYIILENCISNLNKEQLREIVQLIIASISDRRVLFFMLDLANLQKRLQIEELYILIVDFLNNRTIISNEPDLRLYGEFCQIIGSGAEVFVKRLMQSVVSISKAEELKQCLDYLQISTWTKELFKYFVLLVHNAPNKYIQDYSIQKIAIRFADNGTFVDLLRYLIDCEFYLEIDELSDEILDTAQHQRGFFDFDFRKMWSGLLLKRLEDKEDKNFDSLLSKSYIKLDIDIEQFIRDNWRNLPFLTSAWASKNDTSRVHGLDAYLEAQNDVMNKENFDTSMIITSTEEDSSETALAVLAPDSSSIEKPAGSGQHTHDSREVLKELNTNTISPLEKIDSTSAASSNEFQSENVDSQSKNGKTSTKTSGKNTSKNSTKKATSSSLMEFDIHNFTAILNAKLEHAPAKKGNKKRKSSSKTSSTEASPVEMAIIPVLPTEQILSSLDDNCDISEVENDVLSQVDDSDLVEDESVTLNTSKEEEQVASPVAGLRRGRSRTKRKQEAQDTTEELGQHIESPVKKRKTVLAEVPNEKYDFENNTSPTLILDSNDVVVLQQVEVRTDVLNSLDLTSSNEGSRQSELGTFKSQSFNAHSTAIIKGEVHLSDSSQEISEVEHNLLVGNVLHEKENVLSVVPEAEEPESLPKVTSDFENNIAQKTGDVELITKDEIASVPLKNDSQLINTQKVETNDVSPVVSDNLQVEEQIPSEEAALIVFGGDKSVESCKKPPAVFHLIHQLQNEDVTRLSKEERYNMETELLHFMMKLRSVD